MKPPSLQRFAWLSIGAAITTILLKTLAWQLTDSVGLLSDALESGVNLAGALMALAMLSVAALPPDDEHAFGHSKAEYFASGFEGFLILAAALGIAYAAIDRLFNPRPLSAPGLGMLVSIIAALVNFFTARVLLAAGRTYRSITLEADAEHLLSDVWTSAGVVIGVAAVAVTGWLWLDPLLALGVAAYIVWTGWRLVQRSVAGLMDGALPPEQHQMVVAVLDEFRACGIDYHALRTRQSGARGFVNVHILVPGAWSVQRGHDLLEEIETRLRARLPHVATLTHLEPLEDPASNLDISLDRPAPDQTPPQ